MTKYVDLEIWCSFCVYVSIFVTFTLTTNPKFQITYKSWPFWQHRPHNTQYFGQTVNPWHKIYHISCFAHLYFYIQRDQCKIRAFYLTFSRKILPSNVNIIKIHTSNHNNTFEPNIVAHGRTFPHITGAVQWLIRKHSPKTDIFGNAYIINGWNHELPKGSEIRC